ncbi:MAG: hypothetical protein LKI53_09595 [Bacteroidales bacterium]|nr:hypothetical protein [Bacteroidales bacterium]
MDFSLLSKDSDFNIETYFPSITTEFKAVGRDIVITKKTRGISAESNTEQKLLLLPFSFMKRCFFENT